MTQHVWRGSFGPHQNIGLVRKRLLGEREELLESIFIFPFIPNERLRNARLDQRHFGGALRWRVRANGSHSPENQQANTSRWQRKFTEPGGAPQWRLRERDSSHEQRDRKPHDHKRNT